MPIGYAAQATDQKPCVVNVYFYICGDVASERKSDADHVSYGSGVSPLGGGVVIRVRYFVFFCLALWFRPANVCLLFHGKFLCIETFNVVMRF